MRKLLLAALFALVSTVAMAKPIAYKIDNDLGGFLSEYNTKAAIMKGSKVIIDGPCMSACTMYLRTDFDLDVCMTHRAMFGFHKPYWVNPLTKEPVRTMEASRDGAKAWEENFFNRLPIEWRLLLAAKDIPSAGAGDDAGVFLIFPAVAVIGYVPICPAGWEDRYTFAVPNVQQKFKN